MAKRRWTVVLVPHTAEPSKVVEVSYGVLKSLAAAVGVVAVLALLPVSYTHLTLPTILLV